ncbi:TPA: hypothetical protein ACS2XB_002209 [Legionella pneumophila]|nr:hypothetical protein [Legionella pneumophila]MCK1859622.1 hypothetical protein [Legionella pneumophila]HDV5711115.1 hypothetical protein [Legionella pneumophila]HDV5714045.1 hypothetical protein [Legionella pneumophila]HDV5806984.1 hypothetical protein [Legionella pneumophila]HDV5941060.1 hypothetical protein [Legionella pneumophila]
MSLTVDKIAKLLVAHIQDNSLLEKIKDVDSDLFNSLSKKDTENLGFWLIMHSYFLDTVIKEINALNLSEDDLLNSESVKNILTKNIEQYIQNKQDKLSLKKFSPEDFGLNLDSYDYKSLKDELSLMSRGKDAVLSFESVKALVSAKQRRIKEINPNYEAVCIKLTASENSIKGVYDEIQKMPNGTRKQIVCYYGQHVFCLDAQKNENGDLKIFGFESAGDPRFTYTFDRLVGLLRENKENVEAHGCIAGMQRDRMNCSILAISTLTELAKYSDGPFSYISESIPPAKPTTRWFVGNNGSEPDKAIENGMCLSNADIPSSYALSNIDQIQWTDISALPTKIVAMHQSYTAMEGLFKNKPEFEGVDWEKFKEFHKARYGDIEDEKIKYPNVRRRHIFEKIGNFSDALLQEKAENEAKKNYFTSSFSNLLSERMEAIRQHDETQILQSDIAFIFLINDLKTALHGMPSPQNIEFLKEVYGNFMNYTESHHLDMYFPDPVLRNFSIFLKKTYLESILQEKNNQVMASYISDPMLQDKRYELSQEQIEELSITNEQLLYIEKFKSSYDIPTEIAAKNKSNNPLLPIDIKQTKKEDILKKLTEIKDPVLKLKLIDDAFSSFYKGDYNNKFFIINNIKYNNSELKAIKELKEAYKVIVKETDVKNISENDLKLLNETIKQSSLVDFNRTTVRPFIKKETSTRSFVQSELSSKNSMFSDLKTQLQEEKKKHDPNHYLSQLQQFEEGLNKLKEVGQQPSKEQIEYFHHIRDEFVRNTADDKGNLNSDVCELVEKLESIIQPERLSENGGFCRK